MKRPSKVQEARADQSGHADEGFLKKYPTLSGYLSDGKWDDGQPRQLSTLTWSVQDGLWQAALNDKALKQSMYCTAPTQAEALKLMEKALAEGVEAWRPWKKGK